MKYLVLLFTFLSAVTGYSDVLTGKVLDKSTNESLIGATVLLEGTGLGAYTDSKGEFTIRGVSNKKYKLIVSSIGYKTEIRNIDFASDKDITILMDEKSLKTGEIVVSANKRVQAVQEVPISMSIIDSESIISRGNTRLDDALEYVPGVEVNQDNVSIRGSSGFSFGVGSRVALLVDGFPMLSGDNGDMKFDALPMYNVERIEIVKGAGSALYGTSALGGVVNLITAEPKPEAQIKAKTYFGVYTKPRYDEWEYSDSYHYISGFDALYSQKFNKLGVSISGGVVEDESYQAYDDSFRWNTFAKLNYELSEKTNFALNLNATEEDKADWVYWNSLDSATIPPSSTDRSIRIDSKKFGIFGSAEHIFNESHFLNIKSGAYLTNYSNNFDKSSEEFRQSEAVSFNTEIQMNSGISNNILLTYGLNFMNNNVNSRTYGNRNQQIYAAYIQAEYSKIKNMTFTLGARADLEKINSVTNNANDEDPDGIFNFFENFLIDGLMISPKIGWSFKVSNNLNLRASAGTGFRAPSIAERFSSVSFQGFEVIPNNNLKAEKSISVEAGINWETKFHNTPFSIDLAFFDNEMNDLIEPQFITEPDVYIQFNNITRARIIGAEAGIRTFLFDLFGMESSLTVMDPKDLESDNTLKYRSKILWYNTLYIPIGNFEISADYRYKSKVQNIDTELAIQISDTDARVPTHIVDLRLKYDMEKDFSLPVNINLIINNLFDYYYTEMVGNLGLTRRITLQLEGAL